MDKQPPMKRFVAALNTPVGEIFKSSKSDDPKTPADAPKPEDPKPAVETPPRFRVLENATVSIFGAQTHVNVGDEVSDALYGPGAIDKLREAGVKLEAVKS